MGYIVKMLSMQFDSGDGDNDEVGEGFIEKVDFIVFPLHFISMQCQMKSENV